MNTGNQPLVSDEQERHTRRFVNTAALGLDNTVFNLVAHAQTVTPTNTIGLHDQFNGIAECFTIERNGLAFLETNRDGFGFDFNVVTPKRHTHDRLNDFNTRVQVFQILRFVRGAQHVRIGGIGFLGRHFVAETMLLHVFRHFGAPAQLVDKDLIKPGLVNLKVGVG